MRFSSRLSVKVRAWPELTGFRTEVAGCRVFRFVARKFNLRFKRVNDDTHNPSIKKKLTE